MIESDIEQIMLCEFLISLLANLSQIGGCPISTCSRRGRIMPNARNGSRIEHLHVDFVLYVWSCFEACARLHHGTLSKNDAFWEIDVFVLKKLVACGSDLLKTKWLSGFQEGVKLEEAIVHTNKLLAGSAFKWSAQSIQSELSTCAGFLSRIKHNESVADDSPMSPFVTEFLKKLEQLFLVDQYGDKYSTSTSSSTTPPSAQTVLAAILAEQTTKSAGKSLESLVPLSVWRHLLSDEQRTQV
eukprot:6456951-Amphidinium_carterae.1